MIKYKESYDNIEVYKCERCNAEYQVYEGGDIALCSCEVEELI